MNNEFTTLEKIALLALAMGFELGWTLFTVAMITAWGLK
jgi:hypothetical protein